MQASEEKKEYKETDAWVDVLDSLVDFISASKTMIKIMNKKLQAARDKSKSADDISSGVPRSINLPDNSIEELHVNPSFDVYTPQPSMRTEVLQEEIGPKSSNVFPRYHSSSQFLAEQYNLTKQAIARKYRPQNRVASNSPKQIPNEDYFMNEMFTEGLYRISNIASLKPAPNPEKYRRMSGNRPGKTMPYDD